MIVDIEKYREWFAWKREVNRCDLREIQWRLNGQPVTIPEGAHEEFMSWGLSNLDFPATHLGEEGIRVRALRLTKQ